MPSCETRGGDEAISVALAGRSGVATAASDAFSGSAFAAAVVAASAGVTALSDASDVTSLLAAISTGWLSGMVMIFEASPGLVTMASSSPAVSLGTETVATSSETVALPSLDVALSVRE